MNNNKLYIGRIISAVLFAISSIPFFIAFFFESNWKIMNFIICLIPMGIFAVVYFRLDKQMRNRKDCSKYEYLPFYKKCKEKVKASGFNLSEEDKNMIKQCAKESEYFLNIEEDVLFEIYKKGLKEYRAKEKKEKSKNKK